MQKRYNLKSDAVHAHFPILFCVYITGNSGLSERYEMSLTSYRNLRTDVRKITERQSQGNKLHRSLEFFNRTKWRSVIEIEFKRFDLGTVLIS
jgi:hypothetical protein